MSGARFKKFWNKSPIWLRDGITGAVLFLVIWNFLFLLAYIFIIPSLWDILFYIGYPLFYPIVKAMNILFGTCYTASRCFYRLPCIFILMSLIEGFIFGAIIQPLEYFLDKTCKK